jgi:hypothetical protein
MQVPLFSFFNFNLILKVNNLFKSQKGRRLLQEPPLHRGRQSGSRLPERQHSLGRVFQEVWLLFT